MQKEEILNPWEQAPIESYNLDSNINVNRRYLNLYAYKNNVRFKKVNDYNPLTDEDIWERD